MLSVKLKFKPKDHFRNFKISELKIILEKIGFEIVNSGRFLFPAPLSFFKVEMAVEKMLRFLKLDFLMFYQEIVAKKL